MSSPARRFHGWLRHPPAAPVAALMEASAPPTRERIDELLAEHEFPIVEGRRCTFAFRGEADEVLLRHWIYGLSTLQAFRRLPGTDLWVLVLELPEGSRVEYKIQVSRGGSVEWIRDPLNPRLAHDPFGANSVCHARGYVTPEWTQRDPAARPGVLEERAFHSDALGGPRNVKLYFPARYRPSRRYPLLIVHDGTDYLRYAALQTVLDNLIHRLEIPGLVAVLVDPGERGTEYAASDAHARFLTHELVPHLEATLPLGGAPRDRCLMGASLGAVASLHAADTYSGFYGRLLLQSGSFAFTDIGEHGRGPLFDGIVEFVNGFRDAPTQISDRVYMSCGVHESLIYENRSLAPVLQSTGMEFRFEEARDGHNWENWRDRLRVGLSWLFPGPLWMVYE